jgi:hypothetical protein
LPVIVGNDENMSHSVASAMKDWIDPVKQGEKEKRRLT